MEELIPEETNVDYKEMFEQFNNLTSTEIAEKLNYCDEELRLEMLLTALSNSNRNLAEKISEANNIIDKKEVNMFKESVTTGTSKQFLDKLDLKDQQNLARKIELIDNKQQDKRYIEIINDSVKEGIKKR